MRCSSSYGRGTLPKIIEEMPAGYGDTLMAVSPVWVFPVVVIVGIIVSIWIANISMKKHKGIEKLEG